MDITRNWRLKTSRSQLLAARRPDGTIIIPQQSGHPAQPLEVFYFEDALAAAPLGAGEGYAQAAR